MYLFVIKHEYGRNKVIENMYRNSEAFYLSIVYCTLDRDRVRAVWGWAVKIRFYSVFRSVSLSQTAVRTSSWSSHARGAPVRARCCTSTSTAFSAIARSSALYLHNLKIYKLLYLVHCYSILNTHEYLEFIKVVVWR